MANKQSLAPPNISDRAEPQSGMAQCSITKKWFPEDELITFQGQRVSAEGKHILLDRPRTGADEPGTLARPGVFRRIVCISIDWLILLPTWYQLVIAAVAWIAVPLHVSIGHYAFIVLAYSLLAVVSFFYFLILHGGFGKSVGKVLGRLRVVSLDGSRASWERIFVRSALYPGTILIVSACGLLPASPGDGSYRVFGGLVVVTFMIWVLADALVALFDTRMQRSLHDKISGTRAIRDRG